MREAEREEERAYNEVMYYRQAEWETKKKEELFRARLCLDDIPDDELENLIPRAIRLYEMYSPVGFHRFFLFKSLVYFIRFLDASFYLSISVCFLVFSSV